MILRVMLLLMVSAVFGIIPSVAQQYVYSFRGTPVAQALTRISHDHPELKISFIYNELEDYKADADISTDSPVEAIRKLVAFKPISVMAFGDYIYVEAMQKGRYKFSGRVVDEHGETIPFATVMLLAPKDSTVVTYGITDDDGRFMIPCDLSKVVAKLSGTGYLTTYHTGKGFNFGDIVMSTGSIKLKGVTVEAPVATIAVDKSVYTPTGRQKRMAQDGTDLLRIMSMPEVRVDAFSGAVTDNFGTGIPMFINFMPASSQELEGMRTAEVKRVEYLINPTDPRFNGAQRAINFIMQEYEYGGYTKFKADETTIAGFTNNASVFSKFTYRKMVYDLFAGVKNEDNRHNGNTVEGVYTLSDSEGKPFTVTRRQQMESSRFKQNQYPVTFRATYATKKIQLRNVIGFSHTGRPLSSESGSLGYTPSIGTGDYSYSRRGSKRSNSVSFSGVYFFALPHDFSINISPTFSYARTNDFSDFAATNSEQVLRDTRENAKNYQTVAVISKKFNEKHNIGLRGKIGRNSNNVTYAGTSQSVSSFTNTFYVGSLSYQFRSKRLGMYADAGVIGEYSKINGHRATDVYPSCHVELQYAINSKSRLQLFGQFASFTPELSEKTSDVLKDNELLYITGNPYLKDSRVSELHLGYVWFPTNRFSVNAYVAADTRYKRYTVYYEPYKNGTALLRTYINDGDYRHNYVGVNFRWSTSDGKLSLNANPELNFYKTTGIYSKSLTSVFLRAGATWSTGDFYFNADYKMRFKELQNESNILQRGRHEYKLMAGWSNGNFNVRLTAANIFNSGWRRFTREFSSPFYNERRITYASTYHPSVTLSVTYTFGYGKKIKRGNEVGEQKGAPSAILN